MSYAWLAGLLVGALVALVLVWIGYKLWPQQECDERTEQIKTQAGSLSFFLLGGVSFLGWLFDNAQSYLAGQPPRIVSPWSIMLGASIFIYLGANLYYQWQFSVLADLDPAEKVQVRRRAAALFGGAAALGGSARLAFERNQAALGWFLVAFMVVELVVGLYLMGLAKKRSIGQ